MSASVYPPGSRGAPSARRSALAGIALVVLALLALPTDVAGIVAGTPTPSPSAACEVPEGLLTKPVGPGVVRVISDGAGHRLDGGRIREVEVGSDGTIVVAQGRRVIVLGEPGAIEPRTNGWRSYVRFLHLAPWGELWAVEDGGSVVVAEDGRWIDRSGGMRTAGHSIGTMDDGSVWRVVRSPGGPNDVVRLDGTAWVPTMSQGITGSLGNRTGRFDFERTTDGRMWLGIDQGDRPGGIATYDRSGWRNDLPGTGDSVRVLGLTVGPDGSLWAVADRKPHRSRPGEYVLLRYHEGAWSEIGPEEGMPRDEAKQWTAWDPTAPTIITVDAGGRVWFSIYGIGLHRYDGGSFQPVDLPGSDRGVLDLRIGPDDRVWVVSGRGALYLVCADDIDSGRVTAGDDPRLR